MCCSCMVIDFTWLTQRIWRIHIVFKKKNKWTFYCTSVWHFTSSCLISTIHLTFSRHSKHLLHSLTLNVTWRSYQSIVEEVQWRIRLSKSTVHWGWSDNTSSILIQVIQSSSQCSTLGQSQRLLQLFQMVVGLRDHHTDGILKGSQSRNGRIQLM